MNLFRFTVCLLASFFITIPAPDPVIASLDDQEVLSCFGDQMNAALAEKDPAYARDLLELEDEWAKAAGKTSDKSVAAPPYVLPIVFHIVHENGTENIPDTDILRSVDYLNQALANTDYYDPATGVATDIQVCMARRTPDNQTTNGINRIVSPLTSLDSDDDRTLKDLSRWEPRDYVNVWVVKEICGLGLGCGVAGYAYYPSAHGRDIDGIVMEARWLADDEADVSVLIHELGHYLGVRHTFDGGCTNDNCVNDGDRVCDTPPDQSTVAVPCTGSANSCSTDTDSGPFATDQDDMHINYMDYGFFRCYSAFTAGQRERMHFFLEGRRQSLLVSKGCEEPCPLVVTAEFTGGDVTIDVGTSLTFTNTSSNGDSYVWRENGTQFSTAPSPSRLFDNLGTFRIQLVTRPENSTLCDADSVTQTVRVVCPVEASFQLPSPAPGEGETVDFSNTSSGGGTSAWLVNGIPESTAETLNYTFAAPGFYEICLTQSNGFCEDRFCRNLFIRRPPCTGPGCGGEEEECQRPFLANYENSEPSDESASLECVIKSAEGGYVTGGENGGRPLIIRTDEGGEIIWQRELLLEGADAIIKDLVIGPNGEIAGVGDVTLNQQTNSFHFSLTSEGEPRYVHQYSNDNNRAVIFSRIFYPESAGEYLILGSSSLPGTALGSRAPSTFRINSVSGDILDVPNYIFTTAEQNLSAFSDAVYDQTTNLIYTTIVSDGINSGTEAGVSIVALTTTGTVVWARKLSTPPNRAGSFLTTSIALDNNRIVILASIFGQAGLFDVVLTTDLAGEPVSAWFHFFDFFGFNNELIVNEDGYLMIHKGSSSYHFTQMNRNGQILWSLRDNILFPVNQTVQMKCLQEENSLVVAASSLDLIPVLTRLRLTGDSLVGCQPLSRIGVSTEPAIINSDTIVAESLPLDISFFEAGVRETFFELADNFCSIDCPEEEEVDCTDPFRLELTENDAIDDGIFTAVTSRNGVYYVGGRVNFLPYLAALRGNGEIIWQRSIAMLGERHTVRHLDFDDEGMLIGVSSLGPNNSPNPTIFRIDPATGNAAWAQQFLPNNTTSINKLLVPQPGGNYLLIGRSDEFGIRSGMALNIDRATGLPTGPPTVFPGATIGGFYDGVVNPNTGVAYLLSNTLQNTAPQVRVTAVGPNGDIVWNKAYGLSQEEILSRSLYLIDGQLVVANALSGTTGRSVVLTIGLDGELQQAVRHEYPGTSFSIQGIADRSDSEQLELLFYDATQSRWLLNREGIPLINILENSSSRADWRTDLRLTQSFTSDGTYLLIAGQKALAQAPVLEALRIDSISAAQVCEDEFYFPTNYNAGTVNVIVNDLMPIVATNVEALITRTTELVPGALTLFASNSCPQDCLPDEICDNQIDDDQDGLIDCDDPELAQDCCCLPSPTIDLGPETLLCPGDVLREGTDRSFARYEWSTGAQTDSIVISEAGTYWLMITDSCGRTASDTLTLHLRSRPQLELGPDTTLCANAIVPFLAQDGFATYEWTDGTTEKDFTAYEAGTYWVVATDSCGRVQTDTVRVNVDPATLIDLGRDTTICPGDELTFRIDGFSNYQWSQSSFIDCFDCPEVRFAPTTDTLLLLAAQQGPGCFSSDSIRVRVAATTGTHDSVSLCPGDSIIFNDLVLFDAGQYYEIQQISGCERTDTLDVFTLRDTLTSEVLTICSGDSALVFGEYKREPFLYRRTYTIENGCDSTHQVELIVNDTSHTTETIGICSGDSILVFGVYEREPGAYSQTFANTAGCDSTHEVTLEVNEILISTRQIRPDCGGSNPGWGEVLFGSDGTFEVRWSDGSYFKRNERLFADIIYTVTVTDGNGCSVVDSLVVDAAVPPEVQSLVVDESCPGANDGEISILHDRDDLRFRIEQGPYLETSTFRNLADGTYRITIQDGDGCTSRVDLEVEPPEELSLELSETELVVNLGDSVVITPLTEYPLSELRWLIDGVLTCTGCSELVIKPTQSVLITAIAGDNNDCAVNAEALLKVNREDLFYVPNAFSPNGDTLNEEFRVYPGPAVTRILSFEVFDRWGGRVFQRKDYAPEDTLGNWDGLLANGRDPSVGVYVYQVQVELFTGEVISQAGEVLVMR